LIVSIMRLIKADVMGFCGGVRRAVEMAEKAAADVRAAGGGRRLFTLGPLIHNERVLRELAALGFSVLDEADGGRDIAGALVVIRAHGVGPRVRAGLLRRGAEVIDATCPKVRACRMRAQTLAADGFTVFIAGEAAHAEVRGISEAASGSFVVGSAEETAVAAEAVLAGRRMRTDGADGGRVKAALVAQTTLADDEFRAIRAELTRFFPDLAVCDTVCEATKRRQDALAALCGKVDAVVIAGDAASSNTRRLLAIALQHGKPAWIAGSASGLPAGLAAFGTVGLSAGASAPDALIDELERGILAMGNADPPKAGQHEKASTKKPVENP
jgi:4-hydroxy-3-methylbut-2-enyl diphosphate reductase